VRLRVGEFVYVKDIDLVADNVDVVVLDDENERVECVPVFEYVLEQEEDCETLDVLECVRVEVEEWLEADDESEFVRVTEWENVFERDCVCEFVNVDERDDAEQVLLCVDVSVYDVEGVVENETVGEFVSEVDID
jgi:hypothetical protein